MPEKRDANQYDVTATRGMRIVGNQAIARRHLTSEPVSEKGPHGIIGTSRALKLVLDRIALVAPTDATVLIQGETGSGKELAARAVHRSSPRRGAPFVTVSCAAIPAGLLESELFGHERGAFTGALAQRLGRFEMADGGTLFLDEVGDIPLDLQVKLLRVLQEKEFERLGGTRSRRVNVRLVAATNRDLLQMIDGKSFRAELYYRLSVFPIYIPPLRDRPEDIPALVRHFVSTYAARMNKAVPIIPLQTMETMLSYNWPGNIRELQNAVERGVIVSQGAAFELDSDQFAHQATSQWNNGRTLEDVTRNHILRTLDEVNWVVGGPHGAASRLGIPRTTLITKMRRLGIASSRDLARSKTAAC
jgi:formate hydrogenlyase transcriptional activator